MATLIGSLLMLLALTAPSRDAPAEVVLVDGRGSVSLVGHECVGIVRSAVVTRVCHDASRDMALAEIGGRFRAYCDVPRALIDAWLAAPSMGRFHAERIEPAHRCDRS